MPVHKDRPQQLEMMFKRPERSMEELRAELLRHGGRIEALAVTQNRVSMVSVRFDAAGGARVRMHASFLSAPEAVITALGRYLVKRSRHEWLVVRAYVGGMGGAGGGQEGSGFGVQATGKEGGDEDGIFNYETHEKERDGLPRMKARGRVYDLGAIFEVVNRKYFNGKVVCAIGWGRRGSAKRGMARTRMIRFGSYSQIDNAIRVNPMLDNEGVAAEFVEYIVFHEMLHAAMPSVEHGGRRAHHHRAYRMLERRFPGHAQMQKMAVELVGKLRGRGGGGGAKGSGFRGGICSGGGKCGGQGGESRWRARLAELG